MQTRAAPHLSDSHDPGKTDWVMRNPILFFSIFGSIMLAIILFCAYCLWRGPTRAFMPCIKKRSKSSPTKPHAETGDDLKDPNGILSPDRAPGPNLAFWRNSRAASSGDWGHQVYLTDLKRQAEAEAEAERDMGGGWGHDEEAVRYAAAAGGSDRNPVERPRSSLSGQRKSMGIGKSPMSASPLGGKRADITDQDRHSSPLSSTLSQSKLIKHRQSSPAPTSALSSTPSSTTFAHAHPRAMSPASTILPNPALPPRHSSLYSPMSTPLFGAHSVPSRHSSAYPPGPSASYLSPSGPTQYSQVAVNVPPVANMAYSPFTPRQSMSVPVEEGSQVGQRDSIRSNQ